MRRKDKKIEDNKIIIEILSKSTICRIGLTDYKIPYIVPLNYGFHENALYFHSSPKGKKIDLIKKNNNVCFEIEYSNEIIRHNESCKWTTKYRSVIGYGKIEFIHDFEQKIKGLDIIMNHNGKNENYFKKKMVDDILILKLIILDLTAKQSGEW